MTCTTIAKYEPIVFAFGLDRETPDDQLVLSDEAIRDLIQNNSASDLLALQTEFTRSQKNSSQLSPPACMEWLSALPGDFLTIDGEAFPFPKTVDYSKENLEKYLNDKTGLKLSWTQPSDSMLKGIFDLISEGKITHLKIQGGFTLSEDQFESLIQALSNGPRLSSLELSNIQISTNQMIRLSQLVNKLSSLKKLTLESNGIDSSSIPHLVKMININPNLKEIKLTLSLFKSLAEFHTLVNAGNGNQMIDLSANWDAI